MSEKIEINRAPVLTLWAAVVAERLGHDRAAALSLGKALAGLNAHAKGRMLGIYGAGGAAAETEAAPSRKAGAERWVDLMGRSVPARTTGDGLRALKGEEIVDAEAAERYIRKSFGVHAEEARRAMEELAASMDGAALAAEAYGLYERFRPRVPAGRAGWGAKGELDLGLVRSLARNR